MIHDDLACYGTGGGQQLNDQEMALALRALRAVLKRLGVEFAPPYRDYVSFRTYWVRHGAHGSWQARRDLLDNLFTPLHRQLEELEDRSLEGALAEPVSPRAATGWAKVDEEIRELRRRFRASTTPQDYRAVGTHCVGVLEALSRTVYVPEKHLREGEAVPTPDKTKQRIGRYVEDALGGTSNEEVRGLANKAVELAHRVKHGETPSRRDAGISADAVILLSNILRRIQEEF